MNKSGKGSDSRNVNYRVGTSKKDFVSLLVHKELVIVTDRGSSFRDLLNKLMRRDYSSFPATDSERHHY